MTYVTVNTDVRVYVDDVLEELDDGELIEELERRRSDYNTKDINADAMRELLETIWQKRRTGKQFDSELDQLIYGVLGKVI